MQEQALKVINNNALRSILGKKARSHVVADSALEREVANLIAAYQGLT